MPGKNISIYIYDIKGADIYELLFSRKLPLNVLKTYYMIFTLWTKRVNNINSYANNMPVGSVYVTRFHWRTNLLTIELQNSHRLYFVQLVYSRRHEETFKKSFNILIIFIPIPISFICNCVCGSFNHVVFVQQINTHYICSCLEFKLSL